MKTPVDRFGQRRVPKMYQEWNRLREAIRSGASHEDIEAAFEACEEWVDFAFGKNADARA